MHHNLIAVLLVMSLVMISKCKADTDDDYDPYADLDGTFDSYTMEENISLCVVTCAKCHDMLGEVFDHMKCA